MKISKTAFDGLVIIESVVLGDNRGYFFESFKTLEFNHKVTETLFVQDNDSYSTKGVLRGLHFQKPPYAQAKLIRCVQGKILDVVVDIRTSSKTFGQHHKIVLSSENKKQLFIPKGFAHGFIVLSDNALVVYKVDQIYSPDFDAGITWNDPALKIKWGIPFDQIKCSEKDQLLPLLSEIQSPF